MLNTRLGTDNFRIVERKKPISLEEALQILQKHAPKPQAPKRVGLESSLGYALAQEVRAPQDFPPFDRSMMDGYAFDARDAQKAPVRLRVVGESRAGRPFLGRLKSGEAVAILTGAAVPEGADTVLQIEKTQRPDSGEGSLGEEVELLEAVKPGQNIACRGEDQKKGDLLLASGQRIRPQEIAVLASAGCAQPSVFPLPRVAILPTGDELVPPGEEPAFGQIRESNSYALAAQAQRAGFQARRFPAAADDPAKLLAATREALEWADCLLVSGGISVGSYDYVAATFEKLGIASHFHGVDLKPGKPVWFGTVGPRAVFGLPGNPVSSFVIFELFVRPCLENMAGFARERVGMGTTAWRRARFAGGSANRVSRLQIAPACLRDGDSGLEIEAIPWTSSGDFFELSRADALVKIPANTVLAPGSLVEFLPI